MTSIDASARHDLTDAQWALLEPLLPAPPVRGRPRRYPLRAMIDAVRWRTRVGAPWRDVPARYGPWWRAYALYRAWQLNGVWERIEAALVARADAAGKIDWRVSVDTRRRARPRPTRAGPAGTASSAWRGSRTTTPWDGPGADGAPGPRAAVEAGLGAGSLLLTAGQAGDCPMMIPVLEAISVKRPARGRPRTRPDRVLADRAYSSRANRDWLRAHHIRATIPVKADQAANRRRRGGAGGRPPAFDPDVYKDRNAVERGFSRLKHNRGLATRYDKLAVRYRTTTRIAAIDHWLKRLT